MKRVLLKLSGEALAGEKKTGFDEAVVLEVARQVKILVDEGIQVGSSSEAAISGEAGPAKILTGPRRIRSACWLRHELHLRFGDFPFPGHDDVYPDALCLRGIYKDVFQGQEQ